MLKNSNVEKICRVCSGRASYDVFQIIPAYLHEKDDEYVNWNRPICFYLEMILNKPVRANDGFPQKICVLCISYMKHAYNFKSQALKNINLYEEMPVSEPSRRQKSLISDIDELAREIRLDWSDDADDGQEEDTENIFSYTQTNFEEDDLTQLPIFQNSSVSLCLPETFKERKCASCKRLFMFEESYQDHIKDCIQLKLMNFIRDLAQLLQLRENRCISSHEFVRRVIFSVKRMVRFLVEYDNEMQKGSPLLLKSPGKHFLPPPSRAFPRAFVSESDATSNTSSPLCGIHMRCPECNSTFESLTDLETHNFQIHNQSFNCSRTVRRKGGPRAAVRDVDTESSAPEMNNTKTLPRTAPFVGFEHVIKNNLGESSKLVKCSRCDERFRTISHMDLHFSKRHTGPRD